MSKIDMNKKYKTRDGQDVRIICVDSGILHYPVVAIVGKELMMFTAYGNYKIGFEGEEDLIEVSPYEDFKVDDKVLVSVDGDSWEKRYFAYVKNGAPWAWADGATSWSACDTARKWNYCKKFEE